MLVVLLAMPAHAVGQSFHKSRSFSRAAVFEQFKAQMVNRLHVIAVHTPAGHAVALGPFVNVLAWRNALQVAGRPPNRCFRR
jgi:hypothetical protein